MNILMEELKSLPPELIEKLIPIAVKIEELVDKAIWLLERNDS